MSKILHTQRRKKIHIYNKLKIQKRIKHHSSLFWMERKVKKTGIKKN